jgi:hypothetical protein
MLHDRKILPFNAIHQPLKIIVFITAHGFSKGQHSYPLSLSLPFSAHSLPSLAKSAGFI